ncbi:MAG: hypothetical protein PHN88_10430 [Ignavibacteria bacterium]|nr:hypothetical protein [Ignavibacteria bacterium]
MYDDKDKTGILVYTFLFFIALTIFIGFLIYKGIDDNRHDSNVKTQKRTLMKSAN